MNRNYQKELDKIIEKITVAVEGLNGMACKVDEKVIPTLFLHSCCAPCSSYVLEYLRKYFRITVFYYNPNITEDEEYYKRVAEQKRLIAAYNVELTEEKKTSGQITDERLGQASCVSADNVHSSGKDMGAEMMIDKERLGYHIEIVEGNYDPERFYEIAKGLEQCLEGGERCFACYALRLRETAKRAKAGEYDYFTTTLSISPLKNAAKLNEIGEQLAQEYGVVWLPSDFKKRNGYKRSIELSKEYDLYRQDYCGCVYSRRKERE